MVLVAIMRQNAVYTTSGNSSSQNSLAFVTTPAARFFASTDSFDNAGK